MDKKLFRRPLRRDPLFWWALVLLFMAMAATSAEYPGGVTNDADAIAFLIDLVFRAAFYVGMFAGVPALIRRNRRETSEVQTPDEVR